MAEKLFEVSLGYSDGKIVYLSGSGAPAGDLIDAAGKGSYFTDTDSGAQYKKVAAGAGSDKWKVLPTKDYVDNLVAGISWREPVKAADFTFTTVADALTALNGSDQLDGYTVSAGVRVLLAGLTEDPNVYVVGGGTGAWTLTSDPQNTVTKGDTVYVEDGVVNVGSTWNYNGTAWVLIDQATVNELGFIRNFIGKDAKGSEMPTYSSVNVVADSDSLETAIGKVDAEIGAAVATTSLRTAGPIADQAINLNVQALDQAIGANVTSTNVLDAASAVNVNLSALDQYLGTRPTNGTFILNANTVGQNLTALDVAVANTIVRKSADSVTDFATLDEVLVDQIDACEWSVIAIDAANPTKKTILKLFAVHDGTVSADASSTDSNLYSKIELNGAISGLVVAVDLDGSGITQKMRLRVSSISAVNVRAARVKV